MGALSGLSGLSGISGVAGGLLPVSLLSAVVLADGATLRLTFSRAVALIGSAADVYLIGGYYSSNGDAIGAAGAVINVTMAQSPIYAEETLTLDISNETFIDFSGNYLPPVTSGTVTNNSAVAAQNPATALSSKLAAWFPTGPSYWFTDASATVPAADGDPIYVQKDSTGSHSLVQATSGQRPIARYDGATGMWWAEYDGSNDEAQLSTMGITCAGVYAGIKLISFSGVPVLGAIPAQGFGPVWFPDANTLYAGDGNDALNAYTNYANGAASSVWPGTGVWGRAGQEKNSGNISLSNSCHINGSGGGRGPTNMGLTDIVIANATLSAGERSALDFWMFLQQPT